jgi:iron complex transport system substrate-binding protein
MTSLKAIHSRRTVTGMLGGLALTGLAARSMRAQEATSSPVAGASPVGSEWSYTDVLGKSVTLPSRPVRIAANLVTAAALWDLGIKAVAVFDWTASAHPDGDHIAWGNVDAKAVANVGDADGNIQPEELLVAKPDVILTLTFDPANAADTAGVTPDLAGRIEEIAPVLVVTDMASTEIQLTRLVELGESLGADLSQPAIVDAKATYDAKVAELREVAAGKSDLTALFMNFDADAIYAAGPQGVAELEFLGSLGLQFANADSPEAGAFWETLSKEAALKYPSDLLYNDVYSAYQTLEELQAQPVLDAMPAVAAGQVGEWKRDFPVSYAGLTDFLEVILATLRTAEKVTG